jgi:hypothetical protein
MRKQNVEVAVYLMDGAAKSQSVGISATTSHPLTRGLSEREDCDDRMRKEAEMACRNCEGEVRQKELTITKK